MRFTNDNGGGGGSILPPGVGGPLELAAEESIIAIFYTVWFFEMMIHDSMTDSCLRAQVSLGYVSLGSILQCVTVYLPGASSKNSRIYGESDKDMYLSAHSKPRQVDR